VNSLLKRSILGTAKRSSLITHLAAFITRNVATQPDTYGYLRERFIANGKGKSFSESSREGLVRKFERIDAEVPMGSTPTDGLFLAEMLLSMRADGDLVECGCYAGGSSAKLSMLASLLGRKLIVFDSFEGLPVAERYYLRDQHCRRSNDWVTDWAKGRYAASLNEVEKNIRQYGESSVCKLVKGWFNETLTKQNLPGQVAFAFADVDLASSARDCFVAIWPLVASGGIYVTHDTAYIKVLLELYNPELWREQLKSIPPILFGAGYGLCNDSPHIGYMVKGESLNSEYLKSLTIDK
jgi:O-methyltransferase